jgi:hypothetical protein
MILLDKSLGYKWRTIVVGAATEGICNKVAYTVMDTVVEEVDGCFHGCGWL